MKSTARLRVGVLLVLVVVALVSSLGALLWGNQEWDGLALNFGTEMAGAVVTYLLLELVIGRTAKREEERQAKEKEREAKKAGLIAQMGSSVKDVAVAAAEELAQHGWLTDGSLRGAYLREANLKRADLNGAILSGAVLILADLGGAKLNRAKLSGADLSGIDLSRAILNGADLSEADLNGAILRGAYLSEADLEGANLSGANLSRAYLSGAVLILADLEGVELSKDTTLPDGTRWTPDTDMSRFTDPEHPDFWRPEEPS